MVCKCWERLYDFEFTSNKIFIQKFWLGMMGKAGAEKRPSQSLALHCSDRCALQKEKYKDSIQRQMYNIQGQKR